MTQAKFYLHITAVTQQRQPNVPAPINIVLGLAVVTLTCLNVCKSGIAKKPGIAKQIGTASAMLPGGFQIICQAFLHNDSRLLQQVSGCLQDEVCNT